MTEQQLDELKGTSVRIQCSVGRELITLIGERTGSFVKLRSDNTDVDKKVSIHLTNHELERLSKL